MYLIGSTLFILFILLMLVLSVGLPIIIAVLVYRDASKRVDCSPILWALVSALAPAFIGVIVYLILRKDYPLMGEQKGPKEYTYQTYSESDDSGSSYAAYNDYQTQRKPMPTWAKALIIIGIVILAILIIAGVVSLLNRMVNLGSLYGSYHYDF